MLKYALVNDFNIAEVFEMTKEEMFRLSSGEAIFMCMKDTERLSEATPAGVMAFHPTANDPEAWAAVRDAILESRAAQGIKTPTREPLLKTEDGRVLWMPMNAPPDARLN